MGLIFDIKRYSINDGPGIRMSIFMKGCPLSCSWCHNPEGISIHKERLFSDNRCIGCGTCVESCPKNALKINEQGIAIDTGLCSLCCKCTDVCPSRAMEISGKEYSVEEVMSMIEKERIFMDHSGGGVTFCGGEPLLNPSFLLEMLDLCGKASIHRTVDTSMFAEESTVIKVMFQTELFLIDIKHSDPDKHRFYTGVSNEQIFSNIRMVAESGADFIIRIPLIEGVNTDEENISRCAEFLDSLPWERREVNILPYHSAGYGKHKKRGTIYNPLKYNMSTPSEQSILRCIERFSSYGIKVSTGG